MIFVIIFILYLILTINTKKKVNILRTEDLFIESKIMFLKSFAVILIFLLGFVFFFRFLNLFKYHKPIDLIEIKNFLLATNILWLLIMVVLGYLLSRALRNFLVQKLKLTFIKLNLFFLHKSYNYFNFHVKIVSWQAYFWFWFCVKFLKLKKEKKLQFFFYTIRDYLYYFFRYLSIIIIIICIISDLMLNNKQLVYFSIVIPWISMYQLCYNINWYFQNMLNARNDCNLSDFIYPSKYDFDVLNKELLDKLTQYLEDISR